ncbi:MAG: heme exporter protein CcmD [Chromatiaceae bacterium]|nr:heme exporter protein CcmD [Chromatiaceae bacterium]
MMEFLSQGGYAYFVWASYGAALVLLVGEMVQLRRTHRTILTRLGRLLRMRPRGGDS